MSYLPNNPYGPTVPMLPPQLGLGGQASMQAPPLMPPGMNPPSMSPGMNPLAGLPTPGASFPGAGLPGMSPAGIPGMGQDAFSPSASTAGNPAGMPPAGNGQPGGVFQHQSGGFADKNAGLPTGSYWKSWKGISVITTGLGTAGYFLGVAITKKWWPGNWLKDTVVPHGTNGLHSITDGTLKANVAKLVEDAKAAYTTFTKGLTKENATEQHTTFGKTFDEVVTDKLRAEVTENDYKAAEALKTAYLKQADEVKKAVEADSPLDSQAIKDLQAETDKAINAYKKKLEAPPAEGAATVINYGNNALHSIADETLKGKVAKLVGTAKTAHTNFTEGLTKENATERHATFGKTFDEVVSDKLQKEVTEGDYKAAEAMKTAYLNQTEAEKKAVLEGKPLDSQEIKNLGAETDKAVKAYEEKLKAPVA